MRWNMDEIDDILEPGTLRVTSVREPLDMFRSTYNYYYFEHRETSDRLIEKQCNSKCARKLIDYDGVFRLDPQISNRSSFLLIRPIDRVKKCETCVKRIYSNSLSIKYEEFHSFKLPMVALICLSMIF